MKTFSDEALAALQRGDAIVSASVEIIPSGAISYTTLGVIDLDAITNAATTATGGLTAGIDVETALGVTLASTDIIRVSLPTGQTYVAWSAWGIPATSGANHTGSLNNFHVIPDGVAADDFIVGDSQFVDGSGNHFGYDGYEAARAAFGVRTFTGASSYRLYINDNPTADNSGGLSIRVEQGTYVAGQGDPIRLWGGYGDADLPSDAGTSTFKGIGDRGLGQQISAAIGGTAQNLTLTLSGIEPAALALLDPSEVKGASAVVRILFFDSAGKTLLGAYVYTRGRVDELKTSEVVGGAASIQLAIEGAARGLGRNGARLRSDADQRLVSSTDGFYRVVSAAPKKTLYWGGKKPSTMAG
jgi:phosphatidylethanolamine-binding protein (PEBP) family uncharacterized protein